jgi:hypothetical protein
MLFPSVGQAAREPTAPSAFCVSSSTSFGGLVTGNQPNGFVAGGLSFGVIVTGASIDGQVIVEAGPGVTSNVNPPNLASGARPTSPPTTSK